MLSMQRYETCYAQNTVFIVTRKTSMKIKPVIMIYVVGQ